MPIATFENKKQSTADGIQTTFPFPYKFFKNSDLKVYVGSTLKTITTDYSVVGIGSSFANGANVVFTSVPGAGSLITIVRVIPVDQPSDYKDYASFPNEQFNADLDRHTMIEQQLAEETSRQLALHITEAPDLDLTLPPSDTWPNQFLGFDADKKLMVGRPAGAPTSAFMQTVLDDLTAGEALGTLGISTFVKTLLDDVDALAARTTLGVLPDAAIVVTGNMTLSLGRNHLVTAAADLSLPATPVQGERVSIMAEARCRVIQSDSEHAISNRDFLFTTKGATGFLQLKKGDRLRLTYQGAGYVPQQFTKITAPANPPAAQARGTAFSPDGHWLAVGHTTTPFVTFYDLSSGVPVKINDPATLPSGTGNRQPSWSPDSRYCCIPHIGTPFITIYDFDSGAPVKVADPAALPASDAYGSGWSPNGRYLAIAHNTTPFVTIYDWSTGSPVKISNPAALPGGGGGGIAWSPDGRLLAVATSGTPYLVVYDWITGAPVKMADPAALPGFDLSGAAFSPDGRWLILTCLSSGQFIVYDMVSGIAVKVGNPISVGGSATFTPAFSPSGRFLSIGAQAFPFVIYDWLSGYPVKLTLNSPGMDYWGSTWSPDGRYCAIAKTASPYVEIWDGLASASKEWIVDFDSPFGSQGPGHATELRFRFK